MRRLPAPWLVPTALIAALAMTPALTGGPAQAGPERGHGHGEGPDRSVRFATFNASLNRAAPGQLVADLSTPDNQQARNVAETIQRAAPDVVLVNEFDYAPEAVDLFRDNYLEVGQNGADPAHYPYSYVAPSNTGVPSGFDLDNSGTAGGGNDALGFGEFEGQYGMVVYSKYPIDAGHARTFQHFLWRDMPGARLPDDTATPAPGDFYSADELAVLPLSSKSHWDLPIRIGRRTVHFLVSHPTPPVFDGAEDRNGLRNADEIRFWADYVSGGRTASYIRDDEGHRGGLDRQGQFVIAGDLNSDPRDGDSLAGATDQLLDNRRVNTSSTPTSEGAVEASELQGGANEAQVSDPAYDTADFADSTPGNIRADYVLPSKGLRILDSAVFWPTTTDPLHRLTGAYPFPTSDHRLVWVDVRR
ncbi:endonuclease/exonuclease/phosphatase family protein [Nocardioides jensenii]|uniref:endonuclease/exonuclease/phosphatase family protein n=1 Tax=Nocardioides jensenii TaxID=1843 RepID=UPI000831046C|nr:endonuclease/exonuclease/phosphatase family protein [Nocardioides jensenii]